ncbi:N-acetylneuraminate synthase [Thermaurantiacus sp.]
MTSPRCYVIAEAGVNHNGDLALAHALVDAASDAGADAIKFQTFRAADLVAPETPLAAYQVKNLAEHAGGQSMAAMLRDLELTHEAFIELERHARARRIDFLSTAFDAESARFLASLGPRHVKSPSGEITNRGLLRVYGSFGLPVLLSTGMATLGEVEEAIGWLEAAGAGPITILHCVSAYPAPAAEANLRAMDTLAAAFGLPVGWSDHTLGDSVALAAVARGASVLEKHLTLDVAMPGPDHRASLPPDAFALMVKRIREVEEALGSGRKEPTPSEVEIRALARRSLAAADDLDAGMILQEAHLVALRPGTGIAPRELDRVVGRRLARPLRAGTLLRWEDLG